MKDTSNVKTLSFCEKQSLILDAIGQTQSQFLQGKDVKEVFKGLLATLLDATNSQYGFIGEILLDLNGTAFLNTLATNNFDCNQKIRKSDESNSSKGLDSNNLQTFCDRVITDGKYLISNSLFTDPAGERLPQGHPPQIESIMCIPLFNNKKLIGMVGIANRPGGYNKSHINHLEPILATCATIINSFREREGHEETIKKLQEKNEEFETFMYRASHDLRGPVSTIKGLVQIATVESKKTFVHQCMEMVGECANKLDNTLVDLRDIVKIKQSTVEISEIDLERIVKMQISIFQGSRKFDKIKWKVISNIKRSFYSDLTLINIIIQNILDNSIKYIKQVIRVPLIEVNITVAEDSCIMEFSDNGPGIREEYLDKVFHMFFRGNEYSDGTGVGLYLVKNAVEKLAGEIEITSEFNKGCRLKVVLPVKNVKQIVQSKSIDNQLTTQTW